MFLNAKKTAFLGLLLAVTIILVVLSGILDFNTLFLLAGASFGVGIAIRETNLRYGAGFYLASIILSLLLAPNKLYLITYAAMGFYVVIYEFTYEKLTYVNHKISRKSLFWMIKYITFNTMYLPLLIFVPKLFFTGEINAKLIILLMIAGQIALFVYDRAYQYFQSNLWGKVRKKLLQ
ncbi:MAG: hypothetical protein WBI07_17760 [Mobilitalea sp.]